jgi:hypothetical protein
MIAVAVVNDGRAVARRHVRLLVLSRPSQRSTTHAAPTSTNGSAEKRSVSPRRSRSPSARLLTFNWHVVLLVVSAFAIVSHARELPATLVDLRYGLLAFVPWAAPALFGIALSACREPLLARIALATALLMLLFMVNGALGATC